MNRYDDVYELYYPRQIYTYDEGDDGDRMRLTMGLSVLLLACVCSALCGVHSFCELDSLRICGLSAASGGTVIFLF